jgi:molecular chaperone GrpE
MDKNDKKINKDSVEQNENKDKEEIAHLKNKITELENQVKRIFADYQNLEKRVTQEKGQWLIKANKNLILRFLPAIDFLLLSSIHIKDEGLKLSIQKFFDILKEEGVEKIEAVGKKFDPNQMEALKTVVGKENEVIEVLRIGFRMGDEVLRPAEVVVGSAEQKKEVN